MVTVPVSRPREAGPPDGAVSSSAGAVNTEKQGCGIGPVAEQSTARRAPGRRRARHGETAVSPRYPGTGLRQPPCRRSPTQSRRSGPRQFGRCCRHSRPHARNRDRGGVASRSDRPEPPCARCRGCHAARRRPSLLDAIEAARPAHRPGAALAAAKGVVPVPHGTCGRKGWPARGTQRRHARRARRRPTSPHVRHEERSERASAADAPACRAHVLPHVPADHPSQTRRVPPFPTPSLSAT